MEVISNYLDIYQLRNMLADQVGSLVWVPPTFSLGLFQVCKYLLVALVVLAIGWHYMQKRRWVVQMINRIPGPPVSPLLPWLGHAIIVLDLDRCKFQHGTYARK